jgi:hypothetical protein
MVERGIVRLAQAASLPLSTYTPVEENTGDYLYIHIYIYNNYIFIPYKCICICL